MAFFALGWPKWVEIRTGRVKPKVTVSKVRVKLAPPPPLTYAYYNPHPKSLTLKQFLFEGGKFVTSFKRSYFTSKLKLTVPSGTVKPLTKSQVSILFPSESPYGEPEPQAAETPED